MWIDFIKLENFRQYRNETIEFSTPEEGKNFNIIKGTTGAGKTNLLNAITWCFYGKEFHLGRKKTTYPKCNTLTLEELEPGETTNVEVQIQLRGEDDKIVATRSLTFKKSEDGKIRKIQSYSPDGPDGSELKILRKIEGKGMIPVDKIAIETTVPEILREYFIFDGEHLDDYFTETSPKSIREAVLKICQIDALDDTIDHLENVKSQFRKKAKKFTPETKSMQEKLESEEKGLKKYQEELEEIEKDWKEAKEKEEEYREKLKDIDSSEVAQRQKDREKLEKDVKILGKKLKKAKNDKTDFLIKNNPLLLLHDAISYTKEILSKKEESGEIPPDYKKNYIEKLLERGECICKTDISEDADDKTARKNVEEVLRKCDDITNIATELSEENAILRGLLRENKSFKRELEKINNKIKDLKERIDEKDQRIEEIGLQIDGVDVDKVKRWETKRKEYEKIREEKKEKIGTHKANIKLAKKQIENLEKDIQKQLKDEKKGEILRKKLDFCNEALKVVQDVKQEMMENMREEIERKTEQQFLELIWKEKNYSKVIINDDYDVSPIDQQGRDALDILSAGERQALALSFMVALNDVSGFRAPIVIDTPLGRIDEGKPKWQIAENLPNYLKGRQVIMLVTGSEYTPPVRERLQKKTGEEYRIQFEETDVGNNAWVVPYEE